MTTNNGDILSQPFLIADDNIPNRYEDEDESVSDDDIRFARTIFRSRGVPQLLMLSLILSFGISSTIGVIPDVMAHRYASLHHGYTGPDCSTFDRIDKPDACQEGSDDAQETAALGAFFKNMWTLTLNSLIGSISDYDIARSFRPRAWDFVEIGVA